MYKVLLYSDGCLPSFSTFINPLEPDVHHMMSQILSILIDLSTPLYHFLVVFKSLKVNNSGTRKDIKKQ